MLELFTNGFRITALFLIAVFTVIILLQENQSFKKNILLFFLLTTTSYLLAYWELVQANNSLFQIAFFFSVLFPISFWLVSKALFDDDFTWNNKWGLYVILISLLHYTLYRFNEIFSSGIYLQFKFVPYLISVAFILLVIFESLRNKQNDLILARIQKRNAFAIFSAFLGLVSVYYFFRDDPMKLPEGLQLTQNLFTCLFIILFFSDQFEFKNLFVVSQSADGRMKKGKDDIIQKRVIEKLLHEFEHGKIYATEGFTISQLSEVLNEKEYMVRRAINGELGYTNFNNFLNHYRIKEARTLIQKNRLKELTFQEIAFQMGYQSVATFNRAFKKETGQTPSEYSESI